MPKSRTEVRRMSPEPQLMNACLQYLSKILQF